ncbi:MAG: phosphoglycerate dehydrogenase [Nitrospirae bacterium]|nr:phosphoglycerate dehydrogenase [Nitrospirota bacterium]MBI5695178.1 phosphoglycerate dehydrogenase [Nitrospirota bacterium]
MKVLVSDNLSKEGVEIMKKAGLDVTVKTGMTPDELKKEIVGYEGLVIRSATKVTAEVIEAAKNLKVVGRAGSGLDNVDKAAASKKGIVVMNTPGGNTVTTAEHALSMMMSLARNIPQATASLKAGKWEKKKFEGVELYQKTLGIIGMGAIGSQLAKRAQGLGMNVLGFDPFLSKEKAATLGVTIATLDKIYKNSDFISIHSPLTDETRNLISSKTIKKMKDGVRIINCARGGIVNEADLLAALKSGKVAGAALDVFAKEPPEGNPLLEMDNFICTPHLGASTKEAQLNVAVAVAEQVRDYLVYGIVRNAVNVPSIAPDLVPKVQPFITLAEKLGSFLAQVYEGGLDTVTVEYHGEVAEFDSASITTAVLKGLLDPIMEEAVNFVSAPFIAKDRGIEVKEVKSSDAGDYPSLINVVATSGTKSFAVSGALFVKKDPRIVNIDGFALEVMPEGDLLFLMNNDKPGVIGNIGSLMGENKINIARMQFGREKKGGRAISVVSVDAVPSAEVLAKLKKLPNVLSVKHVKI